MSIVEQHADGSVTVNAGAVRGISIANIAGLIAHRVSERDGITRHEIEYKDGGRAVIVYGQGKLLEFELRDMGLSVRNNGVLILHGATEMPALLEQAEASAPSVGTQMH